MTKRYLEVSPDAEKKQEAGYEAWLRAEGIPFVDAEAAAAYRKRVTLFRDALQLKKVPDRIPVCPAPGFFPNEYAGITMYDAMYDHQALSRAVEKYHDDFKPDAYSGPSTVVPGKMLDILDLTFYQWPGHGVGLEREYQYVEGEYMKAQEYQDLIDDPSAFFLSVYFPRIFGALKSLENLPLFPPVNELPMVPTLATPFAAEGMKAALRALEQAGEEALRWRGALREMGLKIMAKGYPSFGGGITKAPFDVIGDTLRGTRGVMIDMFRHPEELKEACERLTPIMVKYAVAGCRASGHFMPYVPLHKGADGFMSKEQFRTFYWPTLRKLIIGLVNEGLVPKLFAEGSYNDRLEEICDVPKGKVLWLFDQTDMKRAKQTVGQVACLCGNVPLSLLCTGTPDDVRAYCRELIAVAGEGGGFIFSSGAGMQGSQAANVRAMMEAAREYGG